MIQRTKDFFYYFATPVGILGSLNFVLYLSAKIPQATAVFIIIWLFIWLFAFTTNKVDRYKHIIILLLEVLALILYGVLLFVILNQYNTFLNSLTPQSLNILTKVLQSFHISIPQLQPDILFVTSLTYGCCLLMIRSLLVIFLKKSKLDNYYLLSNLFEIAYVMDSERLLLKPWFTFARHFSWILLMLGVGLFMYYFGYAYYTHIQMTWIVWLFVPLIFIAFDWHYWLSGDLYKYQFKPSFEGESDQGDKQLFFEDLWRRYHKFWKDKWLVAGNRSTGENR